MENGLRSCRDGALNLHEHTLGPIARLDRKNRARMAVREGLQRWNGATWLAQTQRLVNAQRRIRIVGGVHDLRFGEP